MMKGILFISIVISLIPKFSHAIPFQMEANLDTLSRLLIITYHPNGKIKEEGYQGHYSNQFISTGTYIGEWNTFDPMGKRIQSIYYYNDIPSKAFIEIKKYHQNGLIKSMEKFNNYELYESEIDSIGTWKYFDSKGKLIKQIAHVSKFHRSP